MLRVSALTLNFGTSEVLRGIDIEVNAGDVVGLIGPNGAGKSTLLKCIDGILRPRTGDIVIAGRRLEAFRRAELARLVAYVPQHSGASLSLQVRDIVALGRAPHRGLATKAHDRDIVWRAIERLGLADLSLRPFGQLSGGQRQRVLIARAVAQEGQLMLMDEPTSNLDPYYQLETAHVVQDIVRERGMAALIALHDLSLTARIADVVVLMHDGRVHARGAWRDVLTSENLRATFGVDARIGTDGALPYVIPTLP